MDEMNSVFIDARLKKLEEYFLKYGAKPLEINERNRRLHGQRQSYLYGDTYFRADLTEFDRTPFLIISQITEPDYARIGLMEDVEALPVTLSDEQLEKEVRYAFGLEPYPENYPEWGEKARQSPE